MEDEIDAPSELWDTPGVKAVVKRINNLARANPSKFSGSLKKQITRDLMPASERSDAQEVYEFGVGSSAFPQVSTELLRKEYVNLVRQPILFQECIDQDMEVCLRWNDPTRARLTLSSFIHRPVVIVASAKITSTSPSWRNTPFPQD